MRRAGSSRGAGAGSASAGNDDLIDNGIATLQRATSMDREGQLEGAANVLVQHGAADTAAAVLVQQPHLSNVQQYKHGFVLPPSAS